MFKEIIRHPATHIALALATGLPLVSCTARPDNATGSRNPNNNVTTKATLLPEVLAAGNASAAAQAIENDSFKMQIQAKETAIKYWINLLNYEQTYRAGTENVGVGDNTVAVSVKNMPQVAEIATGKILPETIIKVGSDWRWVSPGTGNIQRAIGEIEVKSIRVSITAPNKPLSAADIANGLFNGKARIDFIQRARYSGFSRINYSVDAIKIPYPDLQPPAGAFSAWKDAYRIITFVNMSPKLEGGSARLSSIGVDVAIPQRTACQIAQLDTNNFCNFS